MSAVNPPTGTRPQPGRNLLETMRRLDRAVHEEVAAMLAEIGYPGVRIAHLLLFIHTPEEEGIRMSQLAERMQLTPGAVTQLVTHLEQHGLMERVRDPSDGRAVIVRPTAQTRRGYAAAWGRVGELLAGWEALAGPGQWDTFRRTLDDIVEWQEARVAERHRSHSRGGSRQPHAIRPSPTPSQKRTPR